MPKTAALRSSPVMRELSEPDLQMLSSSFEQDRLERLDSRVPGLEHVVYHNKLGNQLQRSEKNSKHR